MTAPAQSPIGFDEPAPIGGARPRVRDLIGRTVFIQPTVIERVPKRDSKTGEMQDRITANITVIDGGPLNFGGAPEKDVPVPHTNTVAVPYTAEGVFISQVNIVAALRRSLPTAARPQGGVVPGLIEFGTQSDQSKSRPINLTPLESTDPRRAAAAAVLQAVITGAFVNPEPVEIVAGGPVQTGAAAADPAYAAFLAHQAAQAQQAAAAAKPAVDPAYAAWQAAQAQPAAAGAPVVVDPAYAAFLASQQPAAPAIPPAPAGWTPEVWGNLTAEQRAQILGQSTAAAGAPPL